ncbi:MAG: hypothetical protein ACPL7D_10310 [Candidatus Sumerlaeaceae bacterium]
MFKLGPIPDRNIWAAGALSALLIAIGFLIPCEGVWVVDCGLRLLQLINIVGRHHFGGFWLDYPLQHLDPNFELVPFGLIQTFVHGGRLFAQYPPWFSYATAPFYALFGQCGLRVLPLFTGILLFWGIIWLSRLCGLERPTIPASVAIFATPILPYVYIFWDIIPALAFAVWGQVYLLDATRRSSLPRAVGAGVLLWLAFVMREEYLLWAICCFLAVLLLRPAWRLVAVSAGVFAAGAIALMVVNHAVIGVPLFFRASTGSGKSWEYTWSLASRGWVAYRYLAFVQGAPLADAGLLLALGCLAFVRSASSLQHRVLLVALGTLGAIVTRFFAWDTKQPIVSQYFVNAMVASAPIVFFGLTLWDAPRSGHGRFESLNLRSVVVCSLLFLALTLALSVPSSAVGLNFGPRLLLPIYPGLVLAAFAVMRELWSGGQGPYHRALKALVAFLVLLGLADSVVYLDRLVHQYRQISRLEKFLAATDPGEPIVTEQSWLATMFPRLFYSRVILPGWDGTKIAKSYELAKQLSSTGFLYVAKRPLRLGSSSLAEKLQQIDIPENSRSCDSAFEFYLYHVRP